MRSRGTDTVRYRRPRRRSSSINLPFFVSSWTRGCVMSLVDVYYTSWQGWPPRELVRPQRLKVSRGSRGVRTRIFKMVTTIIFVWEEWVTNGCYIHGADIGYCETLLYTDSEFRWELPDLLVECMWIYNDHPTCFESACFKFYVVFSIGKTGSLYPYVALLLFKASFIVEAASSMDKQFVS